MVVVACLLAEEREQEEEGAGWLDRRTGLAMTLGGAADGRCCLHWDLGVEGQEEGVWEGVWVAWSEKNERKCLKKKKGEVKGDRVARVGPKEEAERTACCGGKSRRGHMRTRTATPLVSLAPPPSFPSCQKIHRRKQKKQAHLLALSLQLSESTLWVYAPVTRPLHSKLAVTSAGSGRANGQKMVLDASLPHPLLFSAQLPSARGSLLGRANVDSG